MIQIKQLISDFDIQVLLSIGFLVHPGMNPEGRALFSQFIFETAHDKQTKKMTLDLSRHSTELST